MPTELSDGERKILLKLARETIACAVRRQPLPELDWQGMPPVFKEPGVCFVTLTMDGELRGCIGALEAYQPLAEDVREHAAAAALEDYRFLPVHPDELPELEIEISRLTTPLPLPYSSPDDLLHKLRPGIDGVILRYASRRATFLPQVWEKIPQPERFLSHLCAKMGVAEDEWQKHKMDVYIYEVEEFHE